MKTRWLMVGVLCASVLALNANAATYRIDDSGTMPGTASVKMRWRTLGPQRGGGNEIDGASLVAVHLNTAPWHNRVGKIYMGLTSPPSGPIQVEWSTQGRLLSGALLSGNRTLVYAGPITGDTLEDTMTVQVHADGTRLNSAERLQFYFEIDID